MTTTTHPTFDTSNMSVEELIRALSNKALFKLRRLPPSKQQVAKGKRQGSWRVTLTYRWTTEHRCTVQSEDLRQALVRAFNSWYDFHRFIHAQSGAMKPREWRKVQRTNRARMYHKHA
jgi:hypothetical protein